MVSNRWFKIICGGKVKERKKKEGKDAVTRGKEILRFVLEVSVLQCEDRRMTPYPGCRTLVARASGDRSGRGQALRPSDSWLLAYGLSGRRAMYG